MFIISLLKKIGNSAKNTATNIGTKSADLVEKGKLKYQCNQLENEAKDKKTQVGDLIYSAYKQQQEPDEHKVLSLLAKIAELDNKISEIKNKLEE